MNATCLPLGITNPTSTLAWIGHSGSSGRRKAIALLKAYFDESGVHANSDVILISGVVGTIDVWDNFDREWAKQLAVPNVPYFHAYDCEVGEGEYQRLSKGLRESLTIGLAGVICENHLRIVRSLLPRPTWKEISSGPPDPDDFRHPYQVCFENCLDQLSKWAAVYASSEQVALIFAEQTEYKGIAYEMYEIYRNIGVWKNFVSITFADPKLFPGLQAADLVCYETYQHYLAVQILNSQEVRPAFRRLIAGDSESIGKDYENDSFWATMRLFHREQ